MQDYTLRLTARALIVQAETLLLVSNNGHFWHTPGGGLNPNETLSECAVREVKEETGIDIEIHDIFSVYDFFDSDKRLHKVEIFFTTKLYAHGIPENWSDQDGHVRYVQFFSFNELRSMHVAPNFLKEGNLLRMRKVYQ